MKYTIGFIFLLKFKKSKGCVFCRFACIWLKVVLRGQPTAKKENVNVYVYVKNYFNFLFPREWMKSSLIAQISEQTAANLYMCVYVFMDMHTYRYV